MSEPPFAYAMPTEAEQAYLDAFKAYYGEIAERWARLRAGMEEITVEPWVVQQTDHPVARFVAFKGDRVYYVSGSPSESVAEAMIADMKRHDAELVNGQPVVWVGNDGAKELGEMLKRCGAHVVEGTPRVNTEPEPTLPLKPRSD